MSTNGNDPFVTVVHSLGNAALGDRFIAALERGERPRLEDFLREAGQPDPVLFRQLVLAEREHRL